MKILHPRQHAHTTSVAWALCLIASSLTLLFSSALMCQAQTCSPTPAPPPDACPPFNYQNCTSPAIPEEFDPLNPVPDPPLELIPIGFQPPDGSTLQWRKFIPAGTGPFPTVLVVHGAGWHAGSPFEPGVEKVSQDLKGRGFLALAVTWLDAGGSRTKTQIMKIRSPAGRPSRRMTSSR